MLKLVFRPWPSLDPGQALSPASLLGAFVSPYLPVTHAHTHSLSLSVGACRVWWGVRGCRVVVSGGRFVGSGLPPLRPFCLRGRKDSVS